MYPSALPYSEQFLAYYSAQDIFIGWSEQMNKHMVHIRKGGSESLCTLSKNTDRRCRSKKQTTLFLTQKAMFITTQSEWMGWSNSQKAETIEKILNKKNHACEFKWYFPVFLLYWWEADNISHIPTAFRHPKSPHHSLCLQPVQGKEILQALNTLNGYCFQPRGNKVLQFQLYMSK